MTNERTDKQTTQVQRGREASLCRSIAKPLIDEMVDQCMNHALALYRGGRLSETQAYAFVAKLDALCGFEDELNDRVRTMEQLEARQLAAQVD